MIFLAPVFFTSAGKFDPELVIWNTFDPYARRLHCLLTRRITILTSPIL